MDRRRDHGTHLGHGGGEEHVVGVLGDHAERVVVEGSTAFLATLAVGHLLGAHDDGAAARGGAAELGGREGLRGGHGESRHDESGVDVDV